MRSSKTLNVEISGDKVRLTKELVLTVEALEDRLKRIKYDGVNRIKDNAVENTMFPPVALSFYEYVFEHNNIPDCDDLIEVYFKKNFKYLPNNKVSIIIDGIERIFSFEAVKARVLRTYPSLVRDLHFCLLIQETGQLGKVYYNFENDYKGAVDLEIYYKGQKFPLALRIATKRSLYYKGLKMKRHTGIPANIVEIELQFNSTTYKIGDFYLYGEKELQVLKAEIEKRLGK